MRLLPGDTINTVAGLGIAIAIVGAVPASAQQVGTAAAVNQDATANGRVLELGASVIHNERIRTDARGSLQLLFIDRTSISIGPNSDLVIDNYVFDPNKKVGQISMSMAKGLMRFVGGQITHTGSATVKAPRATIGIRGGIVDITTDTVRTTVANSFGVVTVTPSGGAPIVVPQGSTGTIAAGAPPSVAPTTQQQVTNHNQQLQSRPGQTGGVSPGTSAAAASYANGTATTATITPASTPAQASPASTTGGSTNPNAASTYFSGGTPSTVTTSSQSVQTTTSTTAATRSPPPAGPGGGPGGPPP